VFGKNFGIREVMDFKSPRKGFFSLFLCNSKSQSLGLICGLVNVVLVVNVCVVYLIIDVFGRKGSEAKPNQT
jgi:hypothetical protein